MLTIVSQSRLDNRVKIGLASNLRPSSARDFRLKMEELQPHREETVDEPAEEVRKKES